MVLAVASILEEAQHASVQCSRKWFAKVLAYELLCSLVQMISNDTAVPLRYNRGVAIVGSRGGRSRPTSARIECADGLSKGRVVVRHALVTLAAIMVASPVQALNPSLSVRQYLHTSWTQEEGSALPPIQALTQTSDGYLWLGTGKGLMRFDGMRFVEWSPTSGLGFPSLDIRCLRPASGGGLWVGTESGVCRVERGKIVRYPSVDSMPCRLITSMVEDRSGNLWMINPCPTTTNLLRLSPSGNLRIYDTRDGLPVDPISALFQDRGGMIWVGTSHAICTWSPGVQAGCSNTTPVDVFSIAEDGRGGLVIADGKRKQAFRISKGHEEPLSLAAPGSALFTPGAMVCDADGNLWVGTLGQGVLRLAQRTVEQFTRNDGLSSNVVAGLLQDHEGDIWVATARGIDRFRDPKVQLLSSQNGLSNDLVNAVTGTHDGTVWIGTAGGLDQLANGQVSQFDSASGLPSGSIISLFEDSTRHLWVGTTRGLAVESKGHFLEVLTTSKEHLGRVFNIGGDASGTVWVVDSARGLFAIHRNLANPINRPELNTHDIYSFLVRRNGDIWLGHHGGGVSVISDDRVIHYRVKDGIAAGPVRALFEDRNSAVWIGTSSGLSVLQNGRWSSWTSNQGLPEGGVQSIIEDDAGCFWLLTPAGILRMSQTPLLTPTKLPSFLLFGRTEGVRLLNGGSMSNPRLAKAVSGTLWFCTEDGIAVIDPARVKTNNVAPPVVIEQLVVDGKPVDITSRGQVSFRGQEVQIGFTGLSLMVPERVRFRYRMYDLDRDWTEAGARRSVTFAHLPPGRYRFKVLASNSDGVWNDQGTELSLHNEPYFYQTDWFAFLCATVATAAVWFSYRLRIQRVVSRYQLIVTERARVSRELHDSLLQGFAGVVYLLEAASRQFDADPGASKKRLEQALDNADQSLREARQMITNMRLPALENRTLAEALKTTLTEMARDMHVSLQFEVRGRVRQTRYDLEANIFLIAREAVMNSLTHASATRIRSELNYGQRELHLIIEDNGSGFDTKAAMTKTGHFGFRGMRERARQIGATFSVESSPGRGTKIDVLVDLSNR